eukprot:scaffold26765_cov208-Skeletonema_menzelii.AAC.3
MADEEDIAALVIDNGSGMCKVAALPGGENSSLLKCEVGWCVAKPAALLLNYNYLMVHPAIPLSSTIKKYTIIGTRQMLVVS